MCAALAYTRAASARDRIFLISGRVRAFASAIRTRSRFAKVFTLDIAAPVLLRVKIAQVFGRGQSQSMREQCHNVVNGFPATDSFSRRYPANPTCANRHNRVDERGSCVITLHGLASA